MSQADYLFKSSVILTTAQMTAAIHATLENESSAYCWNKQKVEDTLGFTDIFNSFETIATSLGAVVDQGGPNNTWRNNNLAVGVPAQMTSHLAALKNLCDLAMQTYDTTFCSLESAGSTIRDAGKAALEAAQAITKTRLTIINKQYPKSYKSYVNKHLHAKLKQDTSGLQNF
jgi:hypothetical protein